MLKRLCLALILFFIAYFHRNIIKKENYFGIRFFTTTSFTSQSCEVEFDRD
jgi:hypothetical protein